MRPGWMARRWLAVPLLVAVPACSPVRGYQDAARSLRFTLDRIEPRLQLAFPLDQSRLVVDLILGVENPSALPFRIRTFSGEVRVDTGAGLQPLGRLDLVQALDLPAGGKAQLAVSASFGYRELAQRWPELQAALREGRPGAWELVGSLEAEVHGFPVRLPVRTRRGFGAEP